MVSSSLFFRIACARIYNLKQPPVYIPQMNRSVDRNIRIYKVPKGEHWKRGLKSWSFKCFIVQPRHFASVLCCLPLAECALLQKPPKKRWRWRWVTSHTLLLLLRKKKERSTRPYLAKSGCLSSYTLHTRRPRLSSCTRQTPKPKEREREREKEEDEEKFVRVCGDNESRATLELQFSFPHF